MITRQIQKTSKTLAIGLKILFIVLLVAIGAEISATIWLAMMSEEGFSTTKGSFQFVSPFVSNGDFSKGDLLSQLCVNISRHIIIVSMVYAAGAIFRDMSRDYTPFAAKHTKRLKVISMLMAAIAVIPAFVQILMMQIITPTVKVYISIELSYIVVAVVFFCLAQIFEYGGMLQQQSDETL